MYTTAVINDPFNMDLHYGFITLFARLSDTELEIDRELGKGKKREEYIYGHYRDLSQSDLPDKQDIGNYGLGLLASISGEHTVGLNYFRKVHQKELKYLNNSIGHCLVEKGELLEAESYFFREIDIDGNTDGAFLNLAEIYREANDQDALLQLWENEKSRAVISPREIRDIHRERGNVLGYFQGLLAEVFRNLNFLGFLGAFLILIVWFFYLRKIDIYQKDSSLPAVYTVLLGMFFTLGVFIIGDFIGEHFIFDSGVEFIDLLLYCVFGIGLVEELVKFIPLLLIIRYTNSVKEPYDYILYASLSALGFAFMENLIYLEETQLDIMHGRGLVAVVLHMFCSSLAAYGLLLNKYKENELKWANIFKYFGLAVLVHGMWDFWIFEPSLNRFAIVQIAMFISFISIWNSLKNNALNHSPHFDKKKIYDQEKLAGYLVVALGSILGFEYIAISILQSPSDANTALLESAIGGSYLLFFLSGRLGRFILIKGQWIPIKYWSKKEVTVTARKEWTVELEPFSKNREASKFLPNRGTIVEQKTVTGEKDWYLIEIEKPALNSAYMQDLVLIRTKEKSESLTLHKSVMVYFYLIPPSVNLDTITLKRRELFFAYWAEATLFPPEEKENRSKTELE